MIEQELIIQGYSLTTRLGGYSFWERGQYPEQVVLFPDGQARIAILGTHTNAMEYLRSVAIKRIIGIVSLLPGVSAYPAIANELSVIGDSLAIYGDVI